LAYWRSSNTSGWSSDYCGRIGQPSSLDDGGTTGGFEFEAAEFDMLFEHFERDLRCDALEYVAVAPLPAFSSDIHSILLEPDFELAELNDTELSQCLRMS
jgi:hypothetical protein